MTRNNEMITIGERIRDIRKRRGMSQEELAEKMFTSKQMISSYENNKTELKLCVLKELSEVLDTPTTYLMEGATETIHYDADTMELIDLFIGISDDVVRKVAIEQLRALKVIQRYKENGI